MKCVPITANPNHTTSIQINDQLNIYASAIKKATCEFCFVSYKSLLTQLTTGHCVYFESVLAFLNLDTAVLTVVAAAVLKPMCYTHTQHKKCYTLETYLRT